jgi:hypothetical protein
MRLILLDRLIHPGPIEAASLNAGAHDTVTHSSYISFSVHVNE